MVVRTIQVVMVQVVVMVMVVVAYVIIGMAVEAEIRVLFESFGDLQHRVRVDITRTRTREMFDNHFAHFRKTKMGKV